MQHESLRVCYAYTTPYIGRDGPEILGVPRITNMPGPGVDQCDVSGLTALVPSQNAEEWKTGCIDDAPFVSSEFTEKVWPLFLFTDCGPNACTVPSVLGASSRTVSPRG